MGSPVSQLGILSNLYLNTGTYNSPVWAAVGLVGDCTVTAEWDEAEASSRLSRGKLSSKSMLALEIAGKLLASKTDTSYATLMSAMANDNVINVMALNGSSNSNGVRGWMFDAQIFKANEDQGLNVAVSDEFSLKPTFSGNAPNQVLVTAGAPVMTSF